MKVAQENPLRASDVYNYIRCENVVLIRACFCIEYDVCRYYAYIYCRTTDACSKVEHYIRIEARKFERDDSWMFFPLIFFLSTLLVANRSSNNKYIRKFNRWTIINRTARGKFEFQTQTYLENTHFTCVTRETDVTHIVSNNSLIPFFQLKITPLRAREFRQNIHIPR